MKNSSLPAILIAILVSHLFATLLIGIAQTAKAAQADRAPRTPTTLRVVTDTTPMLIEWPIPTETRIYWTNTNPMVADLLVQETWFQERAILSGLRPGVTTVVATDGETVWKVEVRIVDPG